MSDAERQLDLAQAILEANTELPEAPLAERLRLLLQSVTVLVSHCESLAAACIDIETDDDGTTRVRCRNCGAEKTIASSPSRVTLPTPEPPHIDNCLVGSYLTRCPGAVGAPFTRGAAALGLRPGDQRLAASVVDLGQRELATALGIIRGSFTASHARGDAGFYLRPDLAWTLLRAAEVALEEDAEEKRT